MVVIRDATPKDAAAISELYVDVRRVAYAHFFPSAYLDALSVESERALWDTRLGEDRCHTVVAEEAGRVNGFARFGP